MTLSEYHPSLGNFFILPPELRLLIWEHLFDEIHTPPPNDTKHNDNPLSILCASGWLYDEISSHLYNNSTQSIMLNTEYDEQEWMKVRIESKTIKVDLFFEDNAEAKRHFQSFPHWKTKITVYMSPPAQADPGQVVLMWQKATALVDLIIPMTYTCIQQVSVYPVGSWDAEEPPTHWQGGRESFFEMGGMRETIKSPYGYHPDHDIAMLPFLRLGLWLKKPEIKVPALSDKEFDELRHNLMALFNPKGLELRFNSLCSLAKETAVFQIEQTIIETDTFLENSLDELPGPTASFLRRERYRHWFKDGTSWHSPHEENFIDKLSVCPLAVQHMDPSLQKWHLRYVTLICTYFTFLAAEQTESRLNIPVRLKWDNQVWYDKCPDGVPALRELREDLIDVWHEPEIIPFIRIYIDLLLRKRAANRRATNLSWRNSGLELPRG